MPIKSSQEVFNENIARGEEQARKNAQKSKRIRELREQLNTAITKSTFAIAQYEKDRYSAQAKGLKRQIDALQSLSE